MIGLRLDALQHILRISASYVIRTFLDIDVSARCTFVIFRSHRLTCNWGINTRFTEMSVVTTSAGKKLKQHKSNKKDLKHSCTCKNTIADVALTSISRETIYFHDFCSIQKTVLRFSSASRLLLPCFSILGIFRPHFLIKRFLLKRFLTLRT